jgi:asparagine synthetase B (glutamine-hydrolysing)
MKPTLKPAGTKRLKLKLDYMPSDFAFNYNLRRYTMAHGLEARVPFLDPNVIDAVMRAGAYTRPLLSAT